MGYPISWASWDMGYPMYWYMGLMGIPMGSLYSPYGVSQGLAQGPGPRDPYLGPIPKQCMGKPLPDGVLGLGDTPYFGPLFWEYSRVSQTGVNVNPRR